MPKIGFFDYSLILPFSGFRFFSDLLLADPVTRPHAQETQNNRNDIFDDSNMTRESDSKMSQI